VKSELVPNNEGRRHVPLADRILVDAEGLGQLLSCSSRHVQALDASGRLPQPQHLGRRTLWHVPTIRTWCAAGCPARDVFEPDDGTVHLSEGGDS